MKRTKPSGFTLIELLVVISIIALLAALAIPAIGKAMERGKSVACASNLRQIGIGIRAYMNDNDDRLPVNDAANNQSWAQILQAKYVTDWKAFRSPFDARPNVADPSAPVSYGFNANANSTANADMSRWASPSLTIIMAPSPNTGTNVVFIGTGAVPKDIAPASLNAGSPAGTHAARKQINALFGDMHIESNMLWSKFANTGASATNDADKYRWTPF